MANLFPGPLPFALNPAQAVPGPINFASREGQRYFERAVAPLNGDELFDAEPEGLMRFCTALQNRARQFNWTAPGQDRHDRTVGRLFD